MSSDTPHGWKQLHLEDLCERVSVGHVGETSSFFVEKGIGIPFIRSQNVRPGRVELSDIKYISSEFHAKSRKSQLQGGDLLIVRVGQNRGDCAVLPFGVGEINCANIVFARPDKNYSEFLGAYFNTPKGREALLSLSSGSAQLVLNTKAIAKVEVLLPPPNEAKNIGAVSRLLDDRITLLRETNATLETIAQALFKSWFVDFDPVHAKQQGRAPEGMDEATATLFPSGFDESELGLVPNGWLVSTLGDCASYLNRGISPKYVESGGIVVVNQKCIRDFAVDLSKARRHDPSQRKIDGRELCVGDVLVNSTGVGTLGRVAQVLTLDEMAIVDSHVTVVRADTRLGWNYVGLALMRKQPEIEGFGEGTTGQTELSRGKLASIKMLVPSKSILDRFDEITVPLRNRFAANHAKAQTLATLRDTLLPRLISGQLRLPEASSVS